MIAPVLRGILALKADVLYLRLTVATRGVAQYMVVTWRTAGWPIGMPWNYWIYGSGCIL